MSNTTRPKRDAKALVLGAAAEHAPPASGWGRVMARRYAELLAPAVSGIALARLEATELHTLVVEQLAAMWDTTEENAFKEAGRKAAAGRWDDYTAALAVLLDALARRVHVPARRDGGRSFSVHDMEAEAVAALTGMMTYSLAIERGEDRLRQVRVSMLRPLGVPERFVAWRGTAGDSYVAYDNRMLQTDVAWGKAGDSLGKERLREAIAVFCQPGDDEPPALAVECLRGLVDSMDGAAPAVEFTRDQVRAAFELAGLA